MITFLFVTGREYLRQEMYFLVTLAVFMQLLPAWITAQSTVADLSASATSDHSTLTPGLETLTPTPVLSSGVALASVTVSPPVVIVDSGGSQTPSYVLDTSYQTVLPAVSNGGGQNSLSDQMISSTEANGGVRNSISDQNASSTTTNTGSSIQTDASSVSSNTGQITDASVASASDLIVSVASSIYVSSTPMVSAVDATGNVSATSNPSAPIVSSSSVDASTNASTTANNIISQSSSVNDGFTSADSTVAIINPTSSASQMAEASVIAVESSFNRRSSSMMDVSTKSAPASKMESASSAIYNPIKSSTIQETNLQTIVSSAYLSSSFMPNSGSAPLYTSKDLGVITSIPMMSSTASIQTFVNNMTDESSPTYTVVSSSPFVSQGEASSNLLNSYSSMLDMTSNLDGVSQTPSVSISPTKASSIAPSDVQTTMPIVLDSNSHISAMSSNLFSQIMSSASVVGSSQSTQLIMSPVLPTLVLTSQSSMVSLPVMSTVAFGQSTSLTATKVILPSSVLPTILPRSSSDNLSSFIASVNITQILPSSASSLVTPSIAESASYSMPLLVSPTIMRTSTFLYSSMFLPPSYVTDLSASLYGTMSSLMTPVLSDLNSASASFGSSSAIMSPTQTLNVTDFLPDMSSRYMSPSSVSINMSAVFPTLSMLASSLNIHQSPTFSVDQSSPSFLSLLPTPTMSVYQSSPSIILPILPTRSSGYLSSIFLSTMSSSSIISFSPQPVSSSSGSMSSMLPSVSVIPTGSASSVINSDFLGSFSSASGYQMTSSINISSFSLSSVAPSTNLPPMPLPSTNLTASSLTIASSVVPSFTYSTDMYTSTASTPLLVSPTPNSPTINLTRSMSILTPTELTSNMNTVNGTLSASLSTNSIYTTMAETSTYSMNMTLMTSSAIAATSDVKSTSLSPTAVQPTPITPTPSSMNFTSTLEASTSLASMENTSVLTPGSTSRIMSSMSSMAIPSSTTFMSSMTSTTSSLMQSSLTATVVTEQTTFSSFSSSQEPSSPAMVASTPSMTLPSNMTSTSKLLSPLDSASTVLPTPSDIFSSNTSTMMPNTSVPMMSSSLSMNTTSSTSTFSTIQMSSAVTMPTSAVVTTPSTTNTTTTPALNVTIAPSISTTPSAGENATSTPALNVTISTSITTTPSSVENVTSSENVTSVNVTMTMVVNMTSMISSNTTDMMSTSVAPVTTTPAPTTTSTTTEPPTTTSSFMATFWTVTDIQVPVSVNVSGDDFVNKMELGLANLYVKAYTRKTDIDASSFDSRKKRKRRRRTATVDDIMVTMQDVKRDSAAPETVSMMYTVEKAEMPVPSVVNSETINLVSDQEMAIELRYVVTKKATPLNWVEPVTTTTTVATTAVPTDNTQIWIIGVVAGGVVILVILAIVGLCIATKKSKKSGIDEEAEPRLMNLKNAPLDDEEEDIRSNERSNSKYSSMADKGSSTNLKVQSPKKQSYEVTSDTRSKEEDEHLYAEVKKPKKPDLASRIGRSKGSQDFPGSENMAEDAELIESPKKKKGEKGRRKSKRKEGDPEDDNEVITKTIHPASLLVPQSQHFMENAYYSAEEEDELKQRKAAERKKNKQRIREKKKKEKRQDKSADQLMVEYLAAQEEIDTVLEAPPSSQDLPEVFVHKKKRGSKSTLEGHDNMALTAEESLNVARSRMHELLDDAFSLISPSASSIGQNQPPEDEGFHSPRTQSPKSPRSQLLLLNQRNLNKVYPADTDALTIGNKHDEDFELYGSEVILVDSRAPSPYAGSESISVPEDTTSTGSYDVRGSSTMKHSPLKMESYKGEPILQTWSPYRAADQVALISMPNKMQTTIGRTPSGRSKRPAADLVGTKSKGNSIPKPAFLKSRDIISTKGSTADLSSTKSQNGDLASRTGKGTSENTEEQEGETTEILQPNDQFEDTEMSKENSMLPSIRARKMAKAAKKRVKNGGGGMEMKTLNGKVGQKHKEPFKNVPNGADEMDIISRSVQSAVTPESTVNSIRNEIRSGLPDKNVVTSFSGPGRNSRASGSLVDIA